jgi:cytidine deaminase
MSQPQIHDPAAAELVAIANRIVGEFALTAADLTAGSVAAALRTAAGNIYTGICLDLACGIGFCAEHAAVAEMLKARERSIVMIVAVAEGAILAPCGRCRELLVQVDRANFATQVVMPNGTLRPLATLLPDHWMPDH